MLQNINMLRTLSCYAIAIFHVCQFANANSETVHLTFRSTPGFHLFLAISGFILVHIIRPSDTPKNFMLKRVVRIVPLYWVTTTLALAMALARPWLLQDADTSWSSIVSSYLFLPHYDLGSDIQPILFVGWTLGYIMLFYLLFSLSLLAPEKAQIPVTILMTVGVIAGAHLLPAGAYREFYGDPILLEFVAGCLVGVALRQKRVAEFARRVPMWPIALLGCVGLGYALHLDYNEGWGEVVTYTPASALVVFACAAQDIYRTPLKSEILNIGGKISYGIFLIHPLLIPVAGVALFRTLDNDWLSTALLFAFVLPMTTLLAYLSFRYFETPANTWLRRRLRLSGSARSAAAQPSGPARQSVV